LSTLLARREGDLVRNWRSEQIRNVALVGHGGSGKTTLVEALAHCAGVLSRVGRVEDGNTLSDYEPEELKRHISTCTSVVNLESEDHLLCVLDAPGYPDFLGEVAAALSACELAVIVVSATDGVQVGTELAFELAEQAGVARMFFVNKLDKERADYEGVVKELVERFGAGVAPIEMPIGSESSFEGVVDLLTDEAIVYVNGRPEHRPIPEGMAATEHTLRDQLVEGIVVGDDDLMERYLDGYVPSPAELEATLATGISKATVFPIVCGSAKSGIGIDRLAELIFEIGPSPLAGPPVSVLAGGSSHPVEPNQSGEPLAYVFKTISDPFVGKVSWLKVLSGHLRPDTNLVNTRSHAEERLHGIFAQRGREQLASPVPPPVRSSRWPRQPRFRPLIPWPLDPPRWWFSPAYRPPAPSTPLRWLRSPTGTRTR
jgi:elongation factor G